MVTSPIDYFSGKYKFLSNFYPLPMKIQAWDYTFEDHVLYRSGEHAFQAAKAFYAGDEDAWHSIIDSRQPGFAKRLGRAVHMNSVNLRYWDKLRVRVMQEVIEAKFKYGSKEAEALKGTFPRMLVEANSWGDKFWGAARIPVGVIGESAYQGDNVLGVLLMDRRARLLEMG